MEDQLSRRARRLLEGHTLPEYIAADHDRRADRWDAVANPDGYIALCTAENKLVWDLLRPRVNGPRDVPPAALGYDDMAGNLGLRERLSSFLGDHLFGRRFDPSQIMVLAGGGAILEALFYAIADPGEGVLVPTPSYAGFWLDLEARDELTIIPVPTASEDGFRLTVDHLDRALAGAERPVRALLFTTPDNPLGRVYEPAEIDEIAKWCDTHQIHAVFDEIYALSVFGDRPFVSIARRRDPLGNSIHIVWAFSKDLAMSGVRAGVLVSENSDVLEAVGSQAMWAATSGDTQNLLREMIGDPEWVDAYLPEMRRRLRAAHAATVAALTNARIQHLPSDAGFFLLLDLRRRLSDRSWDAEAALWHRILDEGNLNLTPGSAFHSPEPGFFRLCFASEPTEAVVVAVERLRRILER